VGARGPYYDDERRAESVRRIALEAAAQVAPLAADARDLRLAELVVQVRSVAVDLVRAVELAGGAEPHAGAPHRRAADRLGLS